MLGFTRAVALETAAQNITCNATLSIEERIARRVAFLCGPDDGSDVTGAAISIDGGWSAP